MDDLTRGRIAAAIALVSLLLSLLVLLLVRYEPGFRVAVRAICGDLRLPILDDLGVGRPEPCARAGSRFRLAGNRLRACRVKGAIADLQPKLAAATV